MTPKTEPAIRIGNLFRRRPITPWSEKEIRQYKKLFKAGCFASLDDLDLIERYYAFERRKGDKGYHRRDLQTFLNNYPSELDRAKAWKEKQMPIVSYKTVPKNGEQPVSDTEFQRLGELARTELEKLRLSLKGCGTLK